MTRKEVEIYAIAGGIAEEVIASFRTVIAFGGQKTELERYKSNLQKTYKTNIKKGFLAGVGFGLVWLFIYASYALSFWYGVTLILKYRNLPLHEQTYTASTMVIVSNLKIPISRLKGTSPEFSNHQLLNKGILQRHDGQY